MKTVLFIIVSVVCVFAQSDSTIVKLDSVTIPPVPQRIQYLRPGWDTSFWVAPNDRYTVKIFKGGILQKLVVYWPKKDTNLLNIQVKSPTYK